MKNIGKLPGLSLLALHQVSDTRNFMRHRGRFTLVPYLFIIALALLLDSTSANRLITSNKYQLGAGACTFLSIEQVLRIIFLR